MAPGTAKTYKILRWNIVVTRGGTNTPWPWTEIVISRRKPTNGR